MIDSVRSILADLASGRIKDERIAMLGAQISELEELACVLNGAERQLFALASTL